MQHDAYTKNERKLLDSIEGFISFSKKKKKNLKNLNPIVYESLCNCLFFHPKHSSKTIFI